MTDRVLLSALIAVSALGAACGGHPKEPSAAQALPAIDARLATASVTAFGRPFEAGGVVRARTTATLVSRIVADVREVKVAPGDRVRKGQVLVVLDARDLTAQQARADAAVQAAEQGLAGATAEHGAAQANAALAKATNARIAPLGARGSATAQELDEAKAAQLGADARVTGAAARIAEATAGLEAARSAAQGARVGTSWASITAPFDGVVSQKLIEAGNMAAPGVPLVTVEDTRGFRVEVRLDADRASQVIVGQPVEVDVDQPARGPAAPLAGRVAELARTQDPGGHTFLVKIDLPEGTAAQSGQFARARFTGPSVQALTIPRAALARRGQITFAFVVDASGVARLRPVSTTEAVGDRLEVLSGLDAGERVVLDPPTHLVDGTPVRERAAAAAGAAK